MTSHVQFKRGDTKGLRSTTSEQWIPGARQQMNKKGTISYRIVDFILEQNGVASIFFFWIVKIITFLDIHGQSKALCLHV